MVGRSGWHWCAGIDRDAGSRLKTPGWRGTAWVGWLLGLCGSTQTSDGLRSGSPRTVRGCCVEDGRVGDAAGGRGEWRGQRSERRLGGALGMAGRSGRHWWAGSDRGAGSRPGTPGWRGTAWVGWLLGLCGSTRLSADSEPAHHERLGAAAWKTGGSQTPPL